MAVEVTGGPEVPFHPGRPVSEISFTGYKIFIIFCGVMHLFAASFIVAVGFIFRKELSNLNCTPIVQFNYEPIIVIIQTSSLYV